MTATPWGFRDILPEEAQAREEIACTVKGCFREHHARIVSWLPRPCAACMPTTLWASMPAWR